MSTVQLLGGTLTAPARALPAAADRASFLPPILVSTAAALLLALVAAPRIDHARAVQDTLDRDPKAAQELSPHDRELAVARAEKLGTAGLVASALLGPALAALAVAVALWVAFRVAGSQPGFPATLAVASWGLLPLGVKALLSVPGLLRLHTLSADQAQGVLPSSLAWVLPTSAPPPLLAVAGAVDLFALWALALVAVGMAHVAGVRRARALAVVLVVWAAWVVVSRVTVPGLLGAGGKAP